MIQRMDRTTRNGVCVIGACALSFVAGCLLTKRLIDQLPVECQTPSEILRFRVVCENSDPNDILIAQAELARHGFYFGVLDSKFGKQTAFAICRMLVEVEDGFVVKSIYEKK